MAYILEDVNIPVDLVGMTKQQAEGQIIALGLKPRIIQEDGQHFIVTQDYDIGRVNLVLENNKVTSYHKG